MSDDRQLVLRDPRQIIDRHAAAEGGINLVDDDISMNGENNSHVPAVGPIVVEPGDREGPCEAAPMRPFFIHAPVHHWHLHENADDMARRAIEILGMQAFQFGQQVEGRMRQLIENADGTNANQIYIRNRQDDALGRMERLQQEVETLKAKLGRLQLDFVNQQAQWETAFAMERQQHKTQMTEFQTQLFQEMEKRLAEQALRIAKSAVEDQDSLKRIVEANVEKRLEEILAVVRIERTRDIEEWDRTLVKRVNTTLTNNQDMSDAELKTVKMSYEQRSQIADQRLDALQNQIDAILAMIPTASGSPRAPTPPRAPIPDSVTSMRGGGSLPEKQGCKLMTQTTLLPAQTGLSGTVPGPSGLGGFGGTGGKPPSSPPPSDDGDTHRDRDPFRRIPRENPLPESLGAGSRLKLDAPIRFDGRVGQSAAITASTWLIDMERWLRLSRVGIADRWDVVATRMSGGAVTWMNSRLRDAAEGREALWTNWEEFRHDVLARYEPLSKEERAREQLRTLSQTGSVHTYVFKFETLRADVPSMNASEAFSLFMRGLQPQMKQFVGSLVTTDDLDAAIELVKKASKYSTGDTSKKDVDATKGKNPKWNKKGQVNVVSAESKAQAELMAVQKNRLKQLKEEADKQAKRNKTLKEEGKKWQEQQNAPKTCWYCGKKGHFVQQCPKIKELEKLKTTADTSGASGSSGN